jgi:diacylglycerol kinase (ATP)
MFVLSWPEWLSLVAVLLAAGALAVAAAAGRRARAAAADRPPVSAPAGGGQPDPLPKLTGDVIAFVTNPTKVGAADLRGAASRACAALRMPEPLWFETTVADPGVGQTRAAIARGATVVVAAGGDGTVRAVAEALAGTAVPMGLIPQGTGNLLARNLDLPLTDLDAALQLALTGTGRTIDVGWLRVVRDESQVWDPVAEAADDVPAVSGPARGPGPDRAADDDRSTGPGARPRDHIFLVIAGLGFDAAMVADTDENLKARVGWIAYFLAAGRHLHGHRLRVRMAIDDAPASTRRVRSLLVGNCGRLPGGITLLPDAELDDGWLDIGAIDTRGGLAGWVQLFGEVVLQGIGMRNELPGKIGRIDHLRARRLRVSADRPAAVQVDGDVLGLAMEITVRVDPGALTVRVG